MKSLNPADHPGVYKIKNVLNGRIYVGSSVRPIKYRWSGKYNRYLTNSLKKHGVGNFKFEVLLNCEPSHCLLYEQVFLDQLAPWVETGAGYNFRRQASSSLGSATSIESEKARITRRRCLGAAAQQRYLQRKGAARRPRHLVAVESIHIESGEVTEYPSISSAVHNGFWHGCILNCLRNHAMAHKGFYWRHLIGSEAEE